MEACLHFRGAALNASKAGISRATECWRSTPHCGSEGDHSSPVGTEGHCKLESYDFGAERKRLKSPDRCLFNRAMRVIDGCVLWLSEKGAEGKCRLTLKWVGINVRRVATRAGALRGESQVSNDFPKIVDKIPDDRGWNRGKPGVNSVTLQRGSARV